MALKKEFPDSKVVTSPELHSDKTTKAIKELFKTRTGNFEDEHIEASSYPFHHCFVKNFICDKDGVSSLHFVNQLRNDLLNLEFNSKSNDLYKFMQTQELMEKSSDGGLKHSSHNLRTFCSLLRNSMLPWLRDVTGVPLNDEIDMFCARYASTDCLLCHDDELEGRCFAYVYYLTPDWSAKDGGTLDLFDSKTSQNQTELFDPTFIVKSVVPSYNSFIFFEVSPRSFHQVAEVVSSCKTRLSLSGWFHGPTIARPPRPVAVKPELTIYTPAAEEGILSEWIKAEYLSFATQAQVQEQFVDNSEISLHHFLLESKHKEIKQSFTLLNSHNDWWELRGPPNKCRYHSLKLCEDKRQEANDVIRAAIDVINSMVELFKSEEMFLFLSNLTGLSLHPMAGNSDSDTDDDDSNPPTKRLKTNEPGICSGCRFQLRKWNTGCYTLMKDTDAELGEYALDLNLYFTPPGEWSEKFGGCTSYIAANEDEELLTILPTDNCLAVTYRDRKAMRFVKHVNHTTVDAFYDFALVYYE